MFPPGVGSISVNLSTTTKNGQSIIQWTSFIFVSEVAAYRKKKDSNIARYTHGDLTNIVIFVYGFIFTLLPNITLYLSK